MHTSLENLEFSSQRSHDRTKITNGSKRAIVFWFTFLVKSSRYHFSENGLAFLPFLTDQLTTN